jgi:hypothetical protein
MEPDNAAIFGYAEPILSLFHDARLLGTGLAED